MKISGLSTRAMVAEAKCRAQCDAVLEGVTLRVVELDQHLRVMLEVGEDATHESLRQAIPIALQWRERLLALQGPWLGGGRNFLMERLATDGRKPAGLTAALNQRISSLLREHLAFEREKDTARAHLRTREDWFGRRPPGEPVLTNARTGSPLRPGV